MQNVEAKGKVMELKFTRYKVEIRHRTGKYRQVYFFPMNSTSSFLSLSFTYLPERLAPQESSSKVRTRQPKVRSSGRVADISYFSRLYAATA